MRGYSNDQVQKNSEGAKPTVPTPPAALPSTPPAEPSAIVPSVADVDGSASAKAPVLPSEEVGVRLPPELQKLAGTNTNSGEVKDPKGFYWIRVDRVDPYVGQPRRESVRTNFDEFKAGIRAEGQQKPCLVMKIGDRYGLIGGERRWRAVTAIGWTHIKAVFETPASEYDRFKMAAIDNYNAAENLPLEISDTVTFFFEAAIHADLSETARYEVIAKIVGYVPAMCKHYHNLRSLPSEVRRRLEADTPKDQRIGLLMGSFISTVRDPKEQVHLADTAVALKMSVAQLKEYARKRARRLDIEIAGRPRKPSDDYEQFRTFLRRLDEGVGLLSEMGKERFQEMFRRRTPTERAVALRTILKNGRRLVEVRNVLQEFHDELKDS